VHFSGHRHLTVRPLRGAHCIHLAESLWRTQHRFDRTYMNATLAPDFFEFGRSGRVYNRDKTLSCETQTIHARLPLPRLWVWLIAEGEAPATYVSEVTYAEDIERASGGMQRDVAVRRHDELDPTVISNTTLHCWRLSQQDSRGGFSLARSRIIRSDAR
jgi:hypothetical protein